MACCILTAYCMTRLIKTCEFFDLKLINIQYNEFDDGPAEIDGSADKGDPLVTTKISLDGMTCAACVSTVESAVAALDGVERVSVSLPLAHATVVHHTARLPVNDILSCIESRGYGARAGGRTARQNIELLQHAEEIQDLRKAFKSAWMLSSAVSGLETLAGFQLPHGVLQLIRLAAAMLAIWVQIVDAKVVHSKAWRMAWSLSLTMDTLVSLSLTLGVALSLFNTAVFGLHCAAQCTKVYWASGSFLTTVILGGRLLDLILRKQSAMAFARLYELQDRSMPVKLLKRAGRALSSEEFVEATTLAPRDEILIGPASSIPCDCYVLSGETLVDQATMTGESQPAPKKPGDFLMSGTENLSNGIVAVVAKAREDSALERLISSISSATESSSSNTKAEVVISRFVMVILCLTGFGFIQTLRFRPLDAEGLKTINTACERAMAILASACPCALGLATPSAVMAGLDAAWLRGVIVSRGLATFSSISRLTHLILDKTGTLTTGKLTVSEVEGQFDDLQRVLLCAAERDEASSHPVAQAVFQWLLLSLNEEDRRHVSAAKVRSVSNELGKGVTCEVQPQCSQSWYTVHAGNERYFLESDIELPQATILSNNDGHRLLVHFAVDRKYTGSLRLADTVRRGAPAVITHLKTKFGLDIAILTGDLEVEAKRVSELLGISAVASSSLPSEKMMYIERLQSQGPKNCVAMMGDGLNDAPALAAADVGICLSLGLTQASSAVAESTNAQVSDVIFTSPDLSRLPELLVIAQKTIRQANWNMRWAVAYNIIAVALAMGFAEPYGLSVNAASAGTMMAFSSVSVLACSLWLRRDLAKVSFKHTNDARK